MSIQIGDNFKYQGKKPLDGRILYSTVADMVAMSETSLYEGCKAYVIATGKEYQYKSGNTVDPNTGKWRSTEVDLSQYYNKSETNTLLAEKQDVIQMSTMPEASMSLINKVYQYIGTTDSTFTKGHFYKVKTATSYKWHLNYDLDTNDVYTKSLTPTYGSPIYADADCTIQGTNYNVNVGKTGVYVVGGGDGGFLRVRCVYPDTDYYNAWDSGAPSTQTRVDGWEEVDLGGTDYSPLNNKPSVNNVTLSGNKTSSDLGLQDVMQMITMPTLGLDIDGRIYQYVGETSQDFTNGHFYRAVCTSVTKWNFDRDNVTYYGTGSSPYVGEHIYSDFANTNYVTDVYEVSVESHTLRTTNGWDMIGGVDFHYETVTTSEWEEIDFGGGSGGTSDFDELLNRPQESDAIDISDLDLPMPAKPTEYPVLFDETGTEYQVGLYKRADGKVKPVYRKTYNYTSSPKGLLSNTWCVLDFSSASMDNIINCQGYAYDSSISKVSQTYPLYTSLGDSSGNFAILQTRNNDANLWYMVLEYTKSTDSWKEV